MPMSFYQQALGWHAYYSLTGHLPGKEMLQKGCFDPLLAAAQQALVTKSMRDCNKVEALAGGS